MKEINVRSRSLARIAVDRVRHRVAPFRWNRASLAGVLAPLPELKAARTALTAGRWNAASEALAQHFLTAPQRFAIAASTREATTERIRLVCPGAADEAAARANRIVNGDHDLLGYRGLRFERAEGGNLPDWHHDPIHERRAPRAFWSSVPYLDPACGDHKIIWELNRHQHWMTLGRAAWLTGEPAYRERAMAELASWLEDNPPLVGINWSSMLELGFRSLSWIWMLHFFVEPKQDERPWIVDLLLGLDRQLTHVEHNLSYYFSPNTHLLGEALALYVSGRALPELLAAPRREALGKRILLSEIGRQICADGGHCERSTHYHRYALDFYILALVIARNTGDPAASAFEEAVGRLADAGRLLADDAGRLPHIGDDDGGRLLPLTDRDPDDISDSLTIAGRLLGRPDFMIGPEPEEAAWLGASPFDKLKASSTPSCVVPSGALPDTGYYVSRSAGGHHLVVDGGPHGYQNGGHAHADALSLTLSICGQPLLVDPGTGQYSGHTDWRDRFRSSHLHNTVVIDGQSQSTPQGPFHWERVAQTRTDRWRTNEAFDYFEGAHDGYQPLEHRRHVFILHGDVLVVADLITGYGPGGPSSNVVCSATAHWHIDPRWSIGSEPGPLTLTSGRDSCQLAVAHGQIELLHGDHTSGLGWQSRVYGQIEPITTARITRTDRPPFWIVSVFGLTAANPVERVDVLPIYAEAGVLKQSVGVRIARQSSTDFLLVAHPSEPRSGATWRLNDFETDGHIFYCSARSDGTVTHVALVDGSLARSRSRGLRVALPQTASDFYIDIAGQTASSHG